jgi:ATP-binding cassette, subfamily F, member 3
VLQEVMSIPNPVPEVTARTILGSFLFQGDDAYKKVSVLSGGEKSRLGLVKLLLNPPNLLLMDEPTTHLDMASIDALIDALKQYQGTLIFISHDVYFIRALAQTVLHISAGNLTPYAGDYDYYLDKSGAGSAKQGLSRASNFPMIGRRKASRAARRRVAGEDRRNKSARKPRNARPFPPRAKRRRPTWSGSSVRLPNWKNGTRKSWHNSKPLRPIRLAATW